MATVQPRAIMDPAARPTATRGSSEASTRRSTWCWATRWMVQTTATTAQPMSGRSAATKMGSARASSTKSNHWSTRRGSEVMEAADDKDQSSDEAQEGTGGREQGGCPYECPQNQSDPRAQRGDRQDGGTRRRPAHHWR